MAHCGVAFLGASGWGKSTLAAQLYACGHEFVADDVLAVRLAESRPAVVSGIPHLKLWPEAAITMGEAVHNLPRTRVLRRCAARVGRLLKKLSKKI